MLKSRLKQRESYLKQKEREAIENDKKRQLSEALQKNEKIPHHLRSEAKNLLNDIIYEVKDEGPSYLPPKIAVTTTHDPSSSLKSFAKHMSLIFNGQNLMRGNMSKEKLNEMCVREGLTHLLIFSGSKGNPTSLTLCKYPCGPTYEFSIFNVKYQRRQKTIGEKAYLVLDGMDSIIGERLKLNLSLCFPKVNDASRLAAFINRNGTIAFRHFLIDNRRLVKECEFDMKLYKVYNSTFDVDGEIDYVLKAYTNTRIDDVLKKEEE